MILEYNHNGQLPNCSAINCDSVHEVMTWMRQYCKAADCNARERFLIGVHQLEDYLAWLRAPRDAGKSLAQSAAAAVLHILGSAEMLGLDVPLPAVWSEFPVCHFDHVRALEYIAYISRQYTYIANCPTGSVRAARIDRDRLEDVICGLIRLILGPVISRAQGFEQELRILENKRWKYEK